MLSRKKTCGIKCKIEKHPSLKQLTSISLYETIDNQLFIFKIIGEENIMNVIKNTQHLIFSTTKVKIFKREGLCLFL
jgi:hypothetical protein